MNKPALSITPPYDSAVNQQNSSTAKPARLSNIELLRCVAMLLVLIVHCDFFALGRPSFDETVAQPAGSFARFFFQSLSIGCVDIFVLISGWFGIRPKWKSMAGFIFQCFFFLFGIYAVMLLTGQAELTLRGLAQCFLLTGWNWFPKAYLGLCILAPILNRFIDQGSERDHRLVLFWFYLFQTGYGWVTSGAAFFMGGYSTISFVGLYLLARYVRLYAPAITQRSRRFDLGVFAAIVLFQAVFAFSVLRLTSKGGSSWVYSYTNPLVILSSLYLLLYFSKLRFTSRAVNWVAASSFAVFLLHTNPNLCRPFYTETVKTLYAGYSGLSFLALTFLFVLAVFALAILLDQPRKWCWERLWPWVDKARLKFDNFL